MRQLVELDHVS